MHARTLQGLKGQAAQGSLYPATHVGRLDGWLANGNYFNFIFPQAA